MTEHEFCRRYHISLSTCMKFIRSGALRFSREAGIDEARFLKDLNTRPERFGRSAEGLRFWAAAQGQNSTAAERRNMWTLALSNEPELLRLEDVSRITGYGHETVRRWAAAGRLHSAAAGRRLYIAKDWLLDMLETEDFNAICRKSGTHLRILAQTVDQDYNVCSR